MGTLKQTYIMSGILASAVMLSGSPSLESPLKESAEALALADLQAEACTGLCNHEPTSETAMGRFLEQEIAERVELVSNRTWTKTSRIRFSRELARAIAKASYEHGVDPFLLLAMVEVESRYNAMAVGTVGERGLMQIKPSTARGIVPKDAPEYDCDLHDIGCNVLTGARYISMLETQTDKRNLEFSSTGDRRMFVLRSYNLGPARAYKLAVEAEVALTDDEDRAPAEQTETPTKSVGPSYAEKISFRAGRFQTRYLQSATSPKEVVTTVALAN